MADRKNYQNLTKEVSTFRSGKYQFSAVHDEAQLAPLLLECRIMRDLIKNLPVFPTLSAQLSHENLLKRYIYSTSIIDGSLINSDSVSEILKDGTRKNKAAKEVLDMRDAVLGVLSDESDGPIEVTEEAIKGLHAIITGLNRTKTAAGESYRTEATAIGSADQGVGHFFTHTPPKILSDIKVLMHSFVAWINQREIMEMDPLLRSALASFHLFLIHPFDNASGKTARLLETQILHQAGGRFAPLLRASFYNDEKDKFFSSIKASLNSRNDVTPLFEFALSAHLKSLKEINETVTSSIRKIALKDYFFTLRSSRELTDKQYSLVTSLLTDPTPVKLSDLFKVNPYRVIYSSSCERTARRDLSKLTEMNLLSPREDKTFALNLKAIGRREGTRKSIKGRC
ncbi:MAG: Fic family protein [Thermodesulfobacteriota bacterium]